VKGGPDPEKLKAELEDIRNFKPVGWILVDFPRTLSQAKLLEKEMTGFQSGVDEE
jgi:adenylate kinase family enzyme